jgi:hypothetical protein
LESEDVLCNFGATYQMRRRKIQEIDIQGEVREGYFEVSWRQPENGSVQTYVASGALFSLLRYSGRKLVLGEDVLPRDLTLTYIRAEEHLKS